ncbi:TetR/AcrR family transcriptional regulator [Rhodococcus opacus]|uniref:TetR/AcrR family transcriptional regulator n=1 Tax=Rhodococcus opacus TaxID=37919 RepID=UPI001FF156D9|nr:TetR/AcrR family transcriptional regulator [Rhodococcus opacus]UOT03276.1 TetR/AcrR family transcriptional regulator [Rhodococcus opacus]
MVKQGKSNSQDAPLSLRERNKIRTRQELLQSALEVFAEAGYGSATVEAIASRAGTSKVTVYSYFPQGREELFRELYEQINTELLERAADIYGRDGHFADRVVELARALFDVAERPLTGRFYSIDDPSLDVALNPVRGHASRMWIELIAKDLQDAQNQGRLVSQAPPEALATLVVGALRSALSEVARGWARSKDLVQALESLVRGLEKR